MCELRDPARRVERSVYRTKGGNVSDMASLCARACAYPSDRAARGSWGQDTTPFPQLPELASSISLRAPLLGHRLRDACKGLASDFPSVRAGRKFPDTWFAPVHDVGGA